MQEVDLYGNLSSRRLDRTVWIIQNRTMPRFHHKAMAKEAGRIMNRSAFVKMNDCLLKAKVRSQSNPGAVTPFTAHQFMVASTTRPEEVYCVSLIPGQDGQCSCPRRAVQHVCLHIALCLLQQGVREGTMLMCLGNLWGSGAGGYSAMYAAKELRSQPLPGQAPYAQQETLVPSEPEAGATPSTFQPSAPPTLCLSSLRAVFEEWYSVAATAECPEILFFAKEGLERTQTFLANRSNMTIPPTDTPMILIPNASTGAGLKRHMDYMERWHRKQPRKAKDPAQPQVAVEGIQAGVPPLVKSRVTARKKKPRSVLAEFQEETAKVSARAAASCEPAPVALQPTLTQHSESMSHVQMASVQLGGHPTGSVPGPGSQEVHQPGMMLNPYSTTPFFSNLTSASLHPNPLAPMLPNQILPVTQLLACDGPGSLPVPPLRQPLPPPSAPNMHGPLQQLLLLQLLGHNPYQPR